MWLLAYFTVTIPHPFSVPARGDQGGCGELWFKIIGTVNMIPAELGLVTQRGGCDSDNKGKRITCEVNLTPDCLEIVAGWWWWWGEDGRRRGWSYEVLR